MGKTDWESYIVTNPHLVPTDYDFSQWHMLYPQIWELPCSYKMWLMDHRENLAVFGNWRITGNSVSLDMSQAMKWFLCEPSRICPSASCPILETVNEGKTQPGGDQHVGHPGHVHSWQSREGRGEGWHWLMNQNWKQTFRDSGTAWMSQSSYCWSKQSPWSSSNDS